MKIQVRHSTIPKMISLINDFKDGVYNETEIDELLSHPDYEMEFSRYNESISKTEFKDFLLQFWTLKEEDITNLHLKMRHRYFLDLYHHADDYLKKLSLVDIPLEVLEDQGTIAKKGLPKDLEIEEVHVVISIGIGASFGYVYRHQVHFDFLQLVKEKTKESLQASIAHEVHHVGFNRLIDPKRMITLPLDQLFYLYLSGEGLAVKYCNNAEGVLTKSIYPGDKNIGLDCYTWDYLNQDFDRTFKRFQRIIIAMRNQQFTKEDFHEELKTYWMTPYTDDQDQQEPPKLMQFRLYSFGNDLWGVIHDVFGKDVVYDTLNNLETFPDVYNRAVESIGKSEYKLRVTS